MATDARSDKGAMQTAHESSTQAKGVEHVAPDVIVDRGSHRLGLLIFALSLGVVLIVGWWFGFHKEDPYTLFKQRHHTRTKLRGLFGRPINIGILHSNKGPMAASEKNVLNATLLAIRELNRRGGVLGREVQAIHANNASTPAQFAREADRLIKEQKVVALFGCWRSSVRRAVIPVLRKHDHVLFYPASYEGLEQSEYVVYLGTTAAQRLDVLLQWAHAQKGMKRFFYVGSDSINARGTKAILQDKLTSMNASLVGHHYIPLGSIQVEHVAQSVMKQRPELIINTMRGVSNLAFFATLRQLGLTSARVPTISLTLAEPELKTMDIGYLIGDYALWNYFQELATPGNRAFLLAYQRMHGIDSHVSASMQVAYNGVKLWAKAVERARSTNPKGVREVLPSIQIKTPEGHLQFNTKHHASRKLHIGQIQENGKFNIVYSTTQPLLPVSFPNSRKTPSWRALLDRISRQTKQTH